jgi:aminomethyltransferase
LHDFLASHQASFENRYGVEVAAAFGDLAAEYQLIRESVGLTDFSYMQKYRIPEAQAIDFLDTLVAGNVARLRFGRVLHTFLADKSGTLVADCYIANNDDEFVMFCESLVDDATLDALLEEHGAAAAGLEKLTDSHAVIGIDGYKAWAVARDLFGSDVLGLPYLSIEKYPFEDTEVRLVRAGKTSEFGYLLMVPAGQAETLMQQLLVSAQKQGGGLCGVKVHNELRLEGRFFNIFAEGSRVKNPLELGLQWMIDFEKDSFVGSEALLAQREKGVARKIIGVRTDAAADGFVIGAALFDSERQVGTVEATCFSHALNARVGLALFPTEIGFAGLDFHLGSTSGTPVRTISMPPIMPKSLTVKLDEV